MRYFPKGLRREAYDRRLTAIHEAGHFVVACHFGFEAFARIWANYDGRTDEVFYLGRCHWWATDSVTPIKERMIGVAGAVAQKVWDDPDGISELFEGSYWDKRVMSSSDWMSCGCEPGFPDWYLIQAAERVARLFNPASCKLWPIVVRLSRDIINVYRQAPKFNPSSVKEPWHRCFPAITCFQETQLDAE
jgi:hypothetical protein